MNELELEIGRQMGATSFYLYQIVKTNPRMKVTQLAIESGLTEPTVRTTLGKLVNANIVKDEAVLVTKVSGYFAYKVNEQNEWKLH